MSEYQEEYRKNNREKLRQQSKEYYLKNKEKVLERQKNYKNNNPEKVKLHRQKHNKSLKKKEYLDKTKEERNLSSKEYYLKNKEQISKKKKQYILDNKEKIQEKNKIYYKKNIDKIREYNSNKRKNDINYKLSRNLRCRLRAALSNKQKTGSAVSDLGCSIDKFVLWIEMNWADGMCWNNYGQWHLDHKIPLCNFNLSNREELLKACNFSNIQPLWANDNFSKGGQS